MTPDQRLIGLDLIELRAMAFGGDPAGAEQVGQRLSRAAAALEQVSASLERAAGQIGLGWQGQGAEAARTGIAGHARWARTAATQTSTAGINASGQAASANYVRTNMPDPGIRSAALGPGASPVGTNMAQAEEAQRNAQLRAVELLEGHAAKSATQRPTAALEAPPGSATGAPLRAAGTGAARGSTTRVSGRPAGPGTATAGGSSAARTFAGARRAPTGIEPRAAGPAGGSVRGGGAPPTRGANVSSGARPLPGTGGLGIPGPAEVPGTGPGVLTTGSAGAGPPVTGRRRTWAPQPPSAVGDGEIRAAGGQSSQVRSPAHGVTASAAHDGRPPTLPARHGAGVNQATEQQASVGDAPERGVHGSREGPRGGGSPVAAGPMGGTVGGATSPSRHERLGYLIDEDCTFDGDPDNGGWVSPPVIGA